MSSRNLRIGTEVPPHLVQLFAETVRDFFANVEGGTTPAQRAAEVRAQDHDAGLDSLAHLIDYTFGTGNQCEVVARFLAGLYNGQDFPFDLSDLRVLDADVFEHCMAVLRVAQRADVEIHEYIPDGSNVFCTILRDWNLIKRAASPPPPAEGFQVAYATYHWAAGYRDVTLCVRFADNADHAAPTELKLNAEDSEQLASDLLHIHKFVWRRGHEPIDKRPEEQRPRWLPEPRHDE